MKSLFILLLSFLSLSAFSAPKSELWPYWDSSNNKSEIIVDHSLWQKFLDQYLVIEGENTLIRYAQVNQQDKAHLDNYIDYLRHTDPRQLTRSQQYPYWVNLYNALTVKIILDAYPISSITKLGGFFSFGPWDEVVTQIEGKEITLNDIEHRILRPIWQDPRTHYAINCASLGCPNLQSQAFTQANSDSLLNKAAGEFINSSKGVLINNQEIQLSSIYDWFSNDFGTQEQLFAHLKKYRPTISTENKQIEYDYNWLLNEKK
jgi:hypothetical protein